jgi:hypothetical protein
MNSTSQDDYDVALSFAGEDRPYAEELAKQLQLSGLKIFYDSFEESKLWGEDLYTHLADIYSKKAAFCVMFLSKYYATKLWTNHERRFAQARAFQENRTYILPLKLDDTEIPGIPVTVGYIDLRKATIDHVAALVLEKVRTLKPSQEIKPYMDTILSSYAASMISRYQDDLSLRKYIPLRCLDSNEKEKGYVEDVMQDFLTDESIPIIVVLGDYGTGKTTLCKHLLVSMCKRLLDDPTSNFVPIYLELRNTAYLFDSPEPLSQILSVYKPKLPSGEHIRYLLILDGYDEILKDKQGISLQSLTSSKLTQRRTKILLTSRTHFFKNEMDAVIELASKSQQGTGLSDMQLQIERIRRNIIHIEEFNTKDIETYLAAEFQENWALYYAKLLKIYNLFDLSHRPILLDLVVKILPDIDESNRITQDTIYGTTVRLWLNREAWRGVDADDMLEFMKSLATTMFLQDTLEINFRNLTEKVQKQFRSKILASIDLTHFDMLIRTSGFITRDLDGNFSFMHRSFMEYFFAKVMEDHIRSRKLKLSRHENVPEYDTWRYADDPKEKENAIKKLQCKLKIKFDKVYSLSDGIVELLESSLTLHYPHDNVTQEISKFTEERTQFREQQRKLNQIAEAIRQDQSIDSQDWRDVSRRVSMIGGGGRIYYTVDHYNFNLLLNSGNLDQDWLFLLGKWQSWIHT